MGWGSGNLGGGSGGLNFKIVGGTSEPSNPKENTILVSTSEKITSWIFAADAPAEPEEGMVWFTTGASSQVAFNAMKKNTIVVYPISAKQYISGAWVDKIAKSYQNGEWVDWITYLFTSGEGEKVSFNRDNGSGVTVSETKTSIKGTVNNIVGGEWYWQTDDKQNLNGKSKLVFVAKCTYQLDDGNESYEGKFIVLDSRFTDCLSPNELSIPVRASVTLVNDSIKKEYVIDVSALNGSYIIAYWGVASVEIYDVFMR